MPIDVLALPNRDTAHPGLKSGLYYPFTTGLSTAAAVSAVDLLFLYPVDVPEDVVVNSLAFRVSTGGAASSAKLGLWANGSNGRPVGAPLLVNNVGASTATAGEIALAVSGTLRYGTPYWVGCKFTGTLPTVVGLSQTDYSLARKIGQVSAINNVAVLALTIAAAYAADMPTFTGAETLSENGAVGTPIIRYRKA